MIDVLRAEAAETFCRYRVHKACRAQAMYSARQTKRIYQRLSK